MLLIFSAVALFRSSIAKFISAVWAYIVLMVNSSCTSLNLLNNYHFSLSTFQTILQQEWSNEIIQTYIYLDIAIYYLLERVDETFSSNISAGYNILITIQCHDCDIDLF